MKIKQTSLCVGLVCFYGKIELYLYNSASAHDHIAVVHNHGLALSDGSLRLVEFKVQCVLIGLRHSGPLLLMVIADASLYTTGLSDALAVNQIDICGGETGCKELRIGGQHNLVTLGVDVLHIHGLGKS